jgi:hypothetical protein
MDYYTSGAYMKGSTERKQQQLVFTVYWCDLYGFTVR